MWSSWGLISCGTAFIVTTSAARQTAGVLRWRRHCNHSRVLRRREPRRKPQIAPQTAFHCSHTTPRGKSRRKPRTANRVIVTVPWDQQWVSGSAGSRSCERLILCVSWELCWQHWHSYSHSSFLQLHNFTHNKTNECVRKMKKFLLNVKNECIHISNSFFFFEFCFFCGFKLK